MKRFVADGTTYKMSVGLANKKHKLFLTRQVGGDDRYVLLAKSVDKEKIVASFVETMQGRCPSFDCSEVLDYLKKSLDEQG